MRSRAHRCRAGSGSWLPSVLFLPQFQAGDRSKPLSVRARASLARACELLAISALPLTEVAAVCGFYDQAHLTRIFKKQLGTTPGAYRQEVKS